MDGQLGKEGKQMATNKKTPATVQAPTRPEWVAFYKAVKVTFDLATKDQEVAKTLRGDLRAFANSFESYDRAYRRKDTLGDSFRTFFALWEKGDLTPDQIRDLKADARAVADELNGTETRADKILKS